MWTRDSADRWGRMEGSPLVLQWGRMSGRAGNPGARYNFAGGSETVVLRRSTSHSYPPRLFLIVSFSPGVAQMQQILVKDLMFWPECKEKEKS